MKISYHYRIARLTIFIGIIFLIIGAAGNVTAQQSQQIDANFKEATSHTAAGDIASFNLTIKNGAEAYVQIGSVSSGFIDVIYIEAADSSSPVQVQFNTRTLGTNTAINNVYNTKNIKSFESSIHGGISNQPKVPLFKNDGNEISFEQYLTELGLIANIDSAESTNQLIRPLQATDYSITVAASKDVSAVFNARDGTANTEVASKVLSLTQSKINKITTYAAPPGQANTITNPELLLNDATKEKTIPLNERAIVEISATGIYGAMVAGPDGNGDLNTDFDRLDEGMSTQVLDSLTKDVKSEQITFDIVQTTQAKNSSPSAINLNAGDENTFILIDQRNDRFLLVIDTSADASYKNSGSPTSDTRFNVSFGYGDKNADEVYEFIPAAAPFEAASSEANYPYYFGGRSEIISSEFEISHSESVRISSSETSEKSQEGDGSGTLVSAIFVLSLVSITIGLIYIYRQ